MKELSIQEIHEGTLGILKKIIDICDKVGVNYYLAYGSLIGAVRHGGFIPWDDDLDIVMLRPDYEVFCQYCMKHERELYPFKLINRQSEKNILIILLGLMICDIRLFTRMFRNMILECLSMCIR